MSKIIYLLLAATALAHIVTSDDATTASPLAKLFEKLQDISSKFNTSELQEDAKKFQESLSPVMTRLKDTWTPVAEDLKNAWANSSVYQEIKKQTDKFLKSDSLPAQN